MAEDGSEADPMNLLPNEVPASLPNSLDGATQLTSNTQGGSETQTLRAQMPATKTRASKNVKTRTRDHMVYGFMWTDEDLIQWGEHRYSAGDNGRRNRDNYLTYAAMSLVFEARNIWSRAEAYPVASETDRYDTDYCIVLAENTSKDAMTTPPQDVIDKLKVALGVTQDPKWRVARGSY